MGWCNRKTAKEIDTVWRLVPEIVNSYLSIVICHLSWEGVMAPAAVWRTAGGEDKIAGIVR